jgi:hypothetical protein
LILEKDTDITELEKVPAYVRRKAVVTPPETGGRSADTNASAKIVTINGVHKLNNQNTFLYQTQD